MVVNMISADKIAQKINGVCDVIDWREIGYFLGVKHWRITYSVLLLIVILPSIIRLFQ